MKRTAAVLLILLNVGNVARSESYRLSDADVRVEEDFQVSPDGTRAIFRSSAGLYSVPITGGSNQLLNGSREYTGDFLVTPNSAHVLYRGGEGELFSAPLEGGPIHELSAGIYGTGEASISSFRVTPDSSRALFRARELPTQVLELFSAPIDSGTATKLSAPLSDGRIVSGSLPEPYRISPDSSTVVYLERNRNSGSTEPEIIYSVPVDGGVVTPLNTPLSSFQPLERHVQITPDSLSVVFGTNTLNIIGDLWKVPIRGGTPSLLTPPEGEGGGIFFSTYLITPDSSTLVYRGRQEFSDIDELFSVSLIDGTTIRLNDRDQGAVQVGPFEMTPDGQTLLMAAAPGLGTGVVRLFSVPTNGGENIALTPPISFSNPSQYQLSPDGEHVVFLTDDLEEGIGTQLYSVPIKGGDIVKLNGPLSQFGQVDQFAFAPDGKSVVFTAPPDIYDVLELYQTAIGGGPAIKLNSPLLPGSTIDTVAAAPLVVTSDGKQVVFRVRNGFMRELHAAILIPEPSGLILVTMSSLMFFCRKVRWR